MMNTEVKSQYMPEPKDRVLVQIPQDSALFKTQWWPKGKVTGTVQKIFKNGKVAVAIDQLPNRSDDGKATMNLDLTDLSKLEGKA